MYWLHTKCRARGANNRTSCPERMPTLASFATLQNTENAIRVAHLNRDRMIVALRCSLLRGVLARLPELRARHAIEVQDRNLQKESQCTLKNCLHP